MTCPGRAEVLSISEDGDVFARVTASIVARALGVERLRREWDNYDLETTEGIKVEVKSAAYLQSWHQDSFSSVQFNVMAKTGWDWQTNQRDPEIRRRADIWHCQVDEAVARSGQSSAVGSLILK